MQVYVRSEDGIADTIFRRLKAWRSCGQIVAVSDGIAGEGATPAISMSMSSCITQTHSQASASAASRNEPVEPDSVRS